MKNILDKLTNWEQWPFKVLYAPISFVWLWYIIRSKAVWFFTPSNPGLTFGGMEGEPKREMYDLLPKNLYPVTYNILPSQSFNQVKEIINEHIQFPCVVKPEIGGQGILFRKIDNIEQLHNYHSKVPVEYIIQEMVTFPMEVSVFYYRMPNEVKGTISGFLHKIPLQVTGDGMSSLHDLIIKYPKSKKRFEELKVQHGHNFDKVLSKGEIYRFTYAANHNRGARFIDLKEQIDDRLISIFDNISLSINDFFYGRYDILCNSVEDLKEGKNYSILEYNGCGAEPNHFYDTGYTLINAYAEILKHWKVLFKISRYNFKTGIPYWPLRKGSKFLKQTKLHYAVIKEADSIIE